MSDFDVFPTLDEPETVAPARAAIATKAASEIDLDKVDLTKIALAHFDSSRTALKTATDTLTDVVHDLSTPGKLADAKSLRQRLINTPLAEARKIEKGLASKLNGARKAVGAELTSIEAGFEAAEKFITPQIEARDAQVAAEKAERDRIEAERTAAHRANIAVLAGYVTQAQGKTSTQILTVINGVSGIDIIPEQWEEFAVGAEIQKTETLEALQALFDRTKTAEDEAAAREAQRLENERAAAALAEQARALAEKEAELNAKLAKIAAAEKAEADRIAAEAQARIDAEARAQAEAQALANAAARQADEDEANRLAQETAAEALQAVADATPADVIADAYEAPAPAADMDAVAEKAWAMPAGPVTFADPSAPTTPEPADLRLGDICGRLGFVMNAAFVAETLGIAPTTTDKNARLYTHPQFIAICNALQAHVSAVAEAVYA